MLKILQYLRIQYLEYNDNLPKYLNASDEPNDNHRSLKSDILGGLTTTEAQKSAWKSLVNCKLYLSNSCVITVVIGDIKLPRTDTVMT